MNRFVITEKPMLAHDITRAICGKEASETARLPISDNGYTVTVYVGYLLEPVEPDAVNPAWGKSWSLDVLPIQIDDWAKEPTKDKKDLVERIDSLLSEAECAINAGDPDDEGQLTVDEVLDYLGHEGEVLRIHVNDNIEKNIVKAFERLVPNKQCRPVGDAAYVRQMADKCFCMNETRLVIKRLGGLFFVGRMQTPTLGLVVNRNEATENHVTRKYYGLIATGGCADASGAPVFKFKPDKDVLAGEKHVFDRDTLDVIKAKLDGSGMSFFTVISKKAENPPLPYNLTVLLSDTFRCYGFSASKTQQTTQDLRDKYEAIIHNRLDSQYLEEGHFTQAPVVLAQAMENVGATWSLDYSVHSKAFNEKNATAHRGIIPQEVNASVADMTGDEAKVYTAIVEHCAMQFPSPAIYDVSTSAFAVDGGEFQAVARRVRETGFKAVFGNVSDEDGDDAASGNPWIGEGDHRLGRIGCAATEKETAPPKSYTKGTPIADMVSIAKYVTDLEVKAILKQKDDGEKDKHDGTGIMATRASVIEKLKERGYLEDVKGKIRSTEKVRAFYHLLPLETRGADVIAHWWPIQ